MHYALFFLLIIPCHTGVLNGLGIAILTSLGVFILQTTQPRVVELGRAVRSVDYRPLLPFESEDNRGVEGSAHQPVRTVHQVKILRFEAALAFFNVSCLCDRLQHEFTGASRNKPNKSPPSFLSVPPLSSSPPLFALAQTLLVR